MYFDSTIFVTNTNFSLIQYELTSLGQVQSISTPSTLYFANKIYTDSTGTNYIYASDLASKVYVYKVAGQTDCLLANPNCTQCNLTSNSNLCIVCETGFNLTTNNSC